MTSMNFHQLLIERENEIVILQSYEPYTVTRTNKIDRDIGQKPPTNHYNNRQ